MTTQDTATPSRGVPAAADAPRTPALYLIFTAALWSTSGVLVKMLDWQPLSIWAGRSAIAFIVFLIYLRRLPRAKPSGAQIVAGLCFLATQLLFITSTKLTTAANAIFLQYTAPVYVVVLAAWFLDERPEQVDWIAMGVIFVGLLFFFGDDLALGDRAPRTGTVGNVLALLSGVTLAGMNVAMRAKGQRNPAETIMLSHLAGGIIGMPSLLRETITLGDLGIIAFLGVVQIGLAFIFYSAAIRHVPAMASTLILTLEPVLNPLWVFLVLGEVPGPWALAGGALVIGAVTGRALISARLSRKLTLERSNV
ncbi:MAG: EamA family transporter [Anaerolineae bacterium]|nr:EamA family transporter [Anaerolineae bacterium]